MSTLLDRHHSLSANLTHFGRFLRSEGFSISADDLAGALSSLELIPPINPDTFELTLQCMLCKRQDDLEKFAQLFQIYWSERRKGEDSKLKEIEEQNDAESSEPPSRPSAPPIHELRKWLNGNREEEETTIETYSTAIALEQKAFSEMSEDEILAIYRLLQRTARMSRKNISRRFSPSRRAALFDLKQTLRASLHKGGELINLKYRKPKPRKYKLIILADISRSMGLYSRFTMHFMLALRPLFTRMEAFVFSLDLQHITEYLSSGIQLQENLDTFIDQAALRSGGTQIGLALQNFQQQYATAMLDKTAKVLIISDGWDMGDQDLIDESMYHIHRQCRQVIWINPLKGNPDYRPEVRGMKAALPHIDHFVSAHNLESLKAIVPILFSSRRKRVGANALTMSV